MAHEATSTPPRTVVRGYAVASRLWRRALAAESLRVAWRASLWSRLAVAAVAVFAAASTAGAGGVPASNAARFDEPVLTHPFGGAADALVSPLARWDSVWYLRIADSGYPRSEPARQAFLPLYPLLVRGVGELGGGSPGARLVAAFAISLLALLISLALLHRLTELELGRRYAAPAVALTCAFPASLFLGAPYSESLFLLASVGAIYAARSGHWAWAALAAAGAAGTRSAGVLLLVPLVLLYLYGPRADRADAVDRSAGRLGALIPRHRPRADLLWLALAPTGLIAYASYLGLVHGDALGFAAVQDLWGREFAGPLAGVRDAVVAAFDGARQLASGRRTPVYFEAAGGDPFRAAALNLMLAGTLGFAVWALIGVARRLPVAYGAYVGVALALAVSYPVGPQPLMSLPRFVAVLFPIFMWLALECERRAITQRVVAISAIGLGLFTSQYASWWFVA